MHVRLDTQVNWLGPQVSPGALVAAGTEALAGRGSTTRHCPRVPNTPCLAHAAAQCHLLQRWQERGQSGQHKSETSCAAAVQWGCSAEGALQLQCSGAAVLKQLCSRAAVQWIAVGNRLCIAAGLQCSRVAATKQVGRVAGLALQYGDSGILLWGPKLQQLHRPLGAP